jgi:hypothetical protein
MQSFKLEHGSKDREPTKVNIISFSDLAEEE